MDNRLDLEACLFISRDFPWGGCDKYGQFIFSTWPEQ